jgi:hypothetical protein
MSFFIPTRSWPNWVTNWKVLHGEFFLAKSDDYVCGERCSRDATEA